MILVIVATGLFSVILWLVATRLPLCWSGDSGVYFSTAVESKVVWRFFKTLWILAWESWSTRGSHWLIAGPQRGRVVIAAGLILCVLLSRLLGLSGAFCKAHVVPEPVTARLTEALEDRGGKGGVCQLKSENANLKTKILELNQKMSRMVPNGVPTKKEQELNGLLEQVNHQLETAERSRHQLGSDVERLTAQRTRLERDVDTLKSKLATIQQEKTELLTKVQQLGLSEKQSFVMVDNDVHLPSDSLSIVEVQHAQEVAKLKSDLDEQQKLVLSLTQQLKERETKMVSVANSSEAKTPPSYSSEDQTLRQNFKELEEKYYRLQSDYEMVQQEIASLRDDQQSKDRHNATYNQVQARGFIEKIDSMTAQVVAKEETLKQKTKEIVQLTEKLKELAVENEAISILKAQSSYGWEGGWWKGGRGLIYWVWGCLCGVGSSPEEEGSCLRKSVKSQLIWDQKIVLEGWLETGAGGRAY
uniref:Uncharacterized protein n=1 Tax=Timema poppense TaxID=170557 RepID=A0A7R9CE97_TIMPO|nr:unnamed protein product [Timema poppensis]